MRGTGLRWSLAQSREEEEGTEGIPMARNTPKRNRLDQTAAEQKLVEGMSKHEQTIPSFVLAGGPVATKDIIAIVQTLIDSAASVDAARAHWQSMVKADRDQRDKVKKFMQVLRQALLAAFAGSAETLEDFGLTVRKERVTTWEQQSAAVAKARATRAARQAREGKGDAGIGGERATRVPVSRAVVPVPSARRI